MANSTTQFPLSHLEQRWALALALAPGLALGLGLGLGLALRLGLRLAPALALALAPEWAQAQTNSRVQEQLLARAKGWARPYLELSSHTKAAAAAAMLLLLYRLQGAHFDDSHSHRPHSRCAQRLAACSRPQRTETTVRSTLLLRNHDRN